MAIETHASSITRRILPFGWGSRVAAPEYLGLLLFLVGLCAYFAATEPLFASSGNLQNLARQASVLAMLAAGQMFVVLAGGIDISVGAQVSVLSIVAVDFSQEMTLWLALALTVAVGCFIGLVNGLLVTVARISPIITTIATWQLLLGFSLWYTNGLPKRSFDPSYTWLGRSEIAFVATPTVLAILLVALAWFLLNRTRLGRYTYAVGGNAEASRLSGVPVRGVVISSYVVCSLFTAFAAITLSSRVASGLPDLGSGLEITTIAAVFIGGVAWGGGAGSVIGALLGVLLLSVLSNGLNLNAVSSNVQTMVNGALILLAVGLNNIRRRVRAI